MLNDTQDIPNPRELYLKNRNHTRLAEEYFRPPPFFLAFFPK